MRRADDDDDGDDDNNDNDDNGVPCPLRCRRRRGHREAGRRVNLWWWAASLLDRFQVVFLAIVPPAMLLLWFGCAEPSEALQIRRQPLPPLVATTPVGHLSLKACCGDSDDYCEEFQRPEEMFGIACCGLQPINQMVEICCDGVTRRRQQASGYVDWCCGNQTLSYDQTCCQGVVHNIPNGECCGTQAYARNNVNVLCCNGVLNVNVEPGLACCGVTPYDGGLRETCCGESVFLKELFDGCCAIRPDDGGGGNATAPTEFRQFNSRTHLCCDEPIERYGDIKCCHLRSKQGDFVPRSYNAATHCCAYPFVAITLKNADGSCVPSDASGGTPTPTSPVSGGGDAAEEESEPDVPPAETEVDGGFGRRPAGGRKLSGGRGLSKSGRRKPSAGRSRSGSGGRRVRPPPELDAEN